MKPKGIDWDKADWSKSNHELAREYGVVRKTVDLARRRRGIQLSKPGHGKGNHEAKGRVIKNQDYVFGTKKAWKRAVRKLYGEACSCCGYHRPPVINHCHHIIAQQDGGLHVVTNGIVLCSRCHDEIHAGLLELPLR